MLYEKQPVDAIFQGNISGTVATKDGGFEEIHFTRGSEVPLAIRIVYSTDSGNSLSTAEKDATTNSLINLSAKFSVGAVVFNAQLTGSCFNAVDINRYKNLEVFVKRVSEPDSSYSKDNFVPAINELPTLTAANITFERVV